MKKVVLMVLLLAGAIVMAQKGEGHHRNAIKNMTSEQIASLQTKKMTLALDLTSEQQEEIYALNLEQAKIRKTKMEERKAQKESDTAKERTSEEKYAMLSERLDNQIARKAEMKKILSEEQFEKFQKMQYRKKKRFNEKKRRKTRKVKSEK